MMPKPLKIAWNRLEIAWNHLETQKNRKIGKKVRFGLTIAGRFVGWTITTVGRLNSNNNNSRLAEQLNNVKDFGEH